MNLHRVDLQGRNLLKEIDLTADEFRHLVNLGARLRLEKRMGQRANRLAGRNIALIFEKASTRTRCAFEVAAHDEGAHVTYLGPGDSQLGFKESVKDTARVLGRMFDGIEYRGSAQEAVETLGAYAGVPVWNGLTNDWHPTQMLADILTMRDHTDRPLAEVTYCYLGDGRNNTANSLLVTGAMLGMDVRICAPAPLQPAAEVQEIAAKLAAGSGARLAVTADIAAAVAGADYLYTDVWLSMGEPEAAWDERIDLLLPYQAENPDAYDQGGHGRHGRGDRITIVAALGGNARSSAASRRLPRSGRDGNDRAVRVVQDRVDDRARAVVHRVPPQHDQVGAGGQADQRPARVAMDELLADRHVRVLGPPAVQQLLEALGRFRLRHVALGFGEDRSRAGNIGIGQVPGVDGDQAGLAQRGLLEGEGQRGAVLGFADADSDQAAGGLGRVADHHDRAGRVDGRVAADRPQDQRRERAVTAGADDQQLRAGPGLGDRLAGRSVQAVGVDEQPRGGLGGSLGRGGQGLVPVLADGVGHRFVVRHRMAADHPGQQRCGGDDPQRGTAQRRLPGGPVDRPQRFRRTVRGGHDWLS
jgi:ornithine carbamoyltransferase